MGMEAAFAQITPEKLTEFLENPALAYEEILPQLASILPRSLAEVEGFADRLEETLRAQRDNFSNLREPAPATGLRTEFDQIASRMLEQAKGQNAQATRLFSLQKDWHVLHYVLNGTNEPGPAPIEKSILGGTEFSIPADYGALRYLTPQEVIEIADALSSIDSRDLVKKLNRKDAEAKCIYLAHNMDNHEEWSHLPELFEDFRSFYQDAANEGNAILLKII